MTATTVFAEIGECVRRIFGSRSSSFTEFVPAYLAVVQRLRPSNSAEQGRTHGRRVIDS